jgi:hypothetical protein
VALAACLTMHLQIIEAGAVIYLRLAFLRALTWPRLDLGSSISNARSRYQAAIFINLALRFASVAVVARS